MSRLARNSKVVSSNLAPATKHIKGLLRLLMGNPFFISGLRQFCVNGVLAVGIYHPPMCPSSCPWFASNCWSSWTQAAGLDARPDSREYDPALGGGLLLYQMHVALRERN